MDIELKVARQAFETGTGKHIIKGNTEYNTRSSSVYRYTQRRTLYEGTYDGSVIRVKVKQQIRSGDRWFATPLHYWGQWRTRGEKTLEWTEKELKQALAGTGGYSAGRM